MYKQLSQKQHYLLLAIGALLIFFVAFAIGNIVADKLNESPSESQTTDIAQLPTLENSRSSMATENESATAPYPTDVIFSEHNGQKCITKIYDLPKDMLPETIPKESFEQNGFCYTFLEMTSKDNISEDSKPYQETITFDSWTNDFNNVYAMTPKQKEITTDDGYSGTLELDTNSIRTESAGYTTQNKRYTVIRSYPNLSAADMTYIPKTITENGKTLQLVDVKWQSDNVAQLDGHDMTNRYTANATYSGTKTVRTSSGYAVTASYTGNVSKITNDTIHYEVVYLGSRIKQTIDWRYPIIAIVALFMLSLMGTLVYWFIQRIRKIEEEERNEVENKNTLTNEKEQPKIARADNATSTGDEQSNSDETIPPQSETPAPRRHIYGVDDDATVYPGVRQ